MIIVSDGYFYFQEDSYFNPTKFRLLKTPENANYVIREENQEIQSEKGWFTSQSKFNLEEAYLIEGKLNVVINIPHLVKEEYKQNKIPIDKIEIQFENEN